MKSLVLGAVTVLAAGDTGSTARRSPAGLAPLEVRGADVSFTLQEEAVGTSLQDSAGRVRPVERILADAGATWARLRLWVDPPQGASDLNSTLVLARRARAAGLRILLDLHYSDSWADPTSQQTPAAWDGQSPARLALTLRDYTEYVVARLAAQGTPVDMVQIGNEITNGMLWPVGQVSVSSGAVTWRRLAALVNAGIAGARAGNPPGHRLSLMIHIDRGGDRAGAASFFDALISAGVTDFEVMGLSYYPYWAGPLAALESNLQHLAHRFPDKSLLVAETAYPWTTTGQGSLHLPSVDQLPEVASYPPSPSGQSAFYAALRDICLAVPGGRGAGFLVWEPAWLPGVPVSPGADASQVNSNLAMFDSAGRSLPSVEVAFAVPGPP